MLLGEAAVLVKTIRRKLKETDTTEQVAECAVEEDVIKTVSSRTCVVVFFWCCIVNRQQNLPTFAGYLRCVGAGQD